MEFLGIGYQELLLVMVLLLVVVGPERLPALAYQIGRAVRTMQRYARAVRDEFSDEITYLEEQVNTVKGEMNSANQAFRDQQREFNRELREATAAPPELLSLPPGSTESKPIEANGVKPATNGTNGAADEQALTDTIEAKRGVAKSGSDKPPLVF